ncbi:MAG: hypothetical protein ACAH80_13665 [Alphaproteobacteria bacterium]
MPVILRELSRSRTVVDVDHRVALYSMIMPSAPDGTRPVVNIQELELSGFESTVEAFLITLFFGGPVTEFKSWPRQVVVVDTNAMTRIRYYFDASYDDVVNLFKSKTDVTVDELLETGATYLGRRIMTRYTISTT